MTQDTAWQGQVLIIGENTSFEQERSNVENINPLAQHRKVTFQKPTWAVLFYW